ncbi:Intracellular hyphae protein 1 [Colletotrichum tanaceti]|uniref:Intracellular hyphae protein 1 n=1 Tax=Colletotrichum tanaceti TaxID=1306861 RepID=A0A4U6XGR7_9PEZI|nr:Intracellular hyphae protein 1 [Colletotrichum tanaceti]TKW54901.1 Intracellular hyphae protein 1 [Colletotrichum tanaceti]
MQISGLFAAMAVVGVASAMSSVVVNSPTVPPPPACTPGPVVDYTAVMNDTLTIISQKFSSGICNIFIESRLNNPNFITIGQALRVPTFVCNPDNASCLSRGGTGTCAPAGPNVQPVRIIANGETFFIIGQILNIAFEFLLAANPGVDPLLLQAGDQINIPICQ